MFFSAISADSAVRRSFFSRRGGNIGAASLQRARASWLGRAASRRRHPHDECGTLILAVAASLNRASVQLDDLLGNGKAEPKTERCPRVGGILLAEALEDMRQELRSDALTGV